MKHKLSNFCQISNKAIKGLNEHNHKIPYSTRWLYVHLNLLEHRFTGKDEDFFFRSIKDLSKDTGMNYHLVIKSIKELEALKFVHTWQMHWIDKETGKKSEKHITAFRLLNV